MKKDIRIQPLLYPMPVILLSTYNEDGSIDVMNAAWGCQIDTDMLGVCLSPHKKTENIARNKAVVIQLATAKHIVEADYVGIVSSHKEPKKFEKSGLHAHKASKVNAPIIEEFPIALECEFLYDDKESGMHYFKVVNASAEEDVLDEKGHVSLKKLDAVLFSTLDSKYYAIGEEVAPAFRCGLAKMK